MTQQPSLLDSVESELAQLRARFTDAAGVLERLSDIRDEFAGMARAYARTELLLDTVEHRWSALEHEMAGAVERAKEARSRLDNRFDELQTANDSRWEEFRAELNRVQEQLLSAHRNTRAELSAQITGLNGDLEHRLDAMRTAMDGQRSTASQHLTELRTDMSARIDEHQRETTARLETTEQHLRAAEAAADAATRQTGTVRLYTLAVGVVSLVAVVLALGAVLITT